MSSSCFEIGGYFGLENLIHYEYYPELIALNTGRNAVACLIRNKNIKKLYIPLFLCDSIYKVCEREGCSYEFYETGTDFQPVFDVTLREDEWLYIVNYYGQILNEAELKRKFGRIIFDNVQAFFQKPVRDIDTIYSCRKFFGVPDGAYLSSDFCPELEQDISKDRMKHILGRYEETASAYYDDYLANEESYNELPIKGMSKLTHNLLGAVDYDQVKKKREENFSVLYRKLQPFNKLEVKEVNGPFAYPMFVWNGMEIKKRLTGQGIYVPTLWPTAIEFGGTAKEFSENILPLPCDQRYTVDDMDRLSNMLISCLDN